MKKTALLLAFLIILLVPLTSSAFPVKRIPTSKYVPSDHWSISVLESIAENKPIRKQSLLDSVNDMVEKQSSVPKTTLAVLLVDYLTDGGQRTPRHVVQHIPTADLADVRRLLVFLNPELSGFNLDVPDVLSKVEREMVQRDVALSSGESREKIDLSGIKAIPQKDTEPVPEAAGLLDLTVNPTFVCMKTGSTFQFKAFGTSSASLEVPVQVQWRTSGDIGFVNSSGVFTATHPGNGMVTAVVQEKEDFTSYAIVRVEPLGPVRIDIEPVKITLEPKQTVEFSVTGYDETDHVVPVKCDLRLEGDIGTLAQTIFTATDSGTGTIVAETLDGKLVCTAEITVLAPVKPQAAVSDSSPDQALDREEEEPSVILESMGELLAGTEEVVGSDGFLNREKLRVALTGRLPDTGAGELAALDTQVTMHFTNIELLDVLNKLFLEADTSLGLFIPYDVQEAMKGISVTGYYKKFAFRDVLNDLIRDNGFYYFVRGNAVLVRKFEEFEIVSEVVPLDYADASYIEGMLAKMGVKDVTVSVDTRINGIVLSVVYSNIEQLEKTRAMVKQLDVPSNQNITEIFHIEYADIQTVLRVVTPLKSNRMGQVIADENTRTLYVSDVPAIVERMRRVIDRMDVRRVDTRIIQLKPSGFKDVQKIKKAVDQGVFGDAGSIKLTSDAKSSSLIITAPVETLEKIERYIAVMEEEFKQIKIEARIFEVALQAESQFGVDWDRILTECRAVAQQGEEDQASVGKDLPSENFMDQTGGSQASGSFRIGAVDHKRCEAMVDRLKALYNVRLLSRQSMITSNNEKTVLVQGDTHTLPTYTLSELSGKFEISGYEEKISGIQLEIVPLVADDNLLLDVRPKVTRFTGFTTTRFGDKIPITNTRETHMKVKLRGSETLMVAGMIQEKEEWKYKRFPLLGHLPFVEKLFSSKDRVEKRSEIVVLLVPRLIDSSGFKSHGSSPAAKTALKRISHIDR